jgi:SAP domain-containing ribonucleoprotein
MSGKDYDTLKVAELRKLLGERNLPVSGRKAELVKCLQEADAEATKELAEAKPESRKCERCHQPFVPKKEEYRFCPDCHKKWLFEQKAPDVQSHLTRAEESFGRYNDYTPARVAYEEALAYFGDGSFVAAVASLQDARNEADRITAQGSIRYAEGLLDEAPEDAKAQVEVARLVAEVEKALSEKKPWKAARLAQDLRAELRNLLPAIREARAQAKREAHEARAQKEREAFIARLQERGRSQKERQASRHGKKSRDHRRDGFMPEDAIAKARDAGYGY